MIQDTSIADRFQEAYGCAPQYIVRAPGRINLIGEHTDYNGGYVLPAALDNEIKMGARLTGGRHLQLFSANYNAQQSFDTHALQDVPSAKGWPNYFLAVADQFRRRGTELPGMQVLIQGDVPLGSGLSSSAAYEVCAATLFNEVCRAGLTLKDIALLAQAAEHSSYVGVRCGIMDQFASALGAAGHALLIDCWTLDYRLVPADTSDVAIVIINSMKRRGLVDSEYNQRRKECEDGLALVRQFAGVEYPSIRHIPMDVFEAYGDRLPEGSRKRLRHNLTENQRVLDFVDSMQRADWATAGRLLYESHASLRDDFEVSCAELDEIVSIAGRCDGVHGCRMTGAGFGGCAVALVRRPDVEAFVETMCARYEERFDKKPVVYVTEAAAGASVRQL